MEKKVLALPVLLVMMLVTLHSGAMSGEGDSFRSFSIKIPGRVQDLIIQDLDQDGLKDIFIVWVEGEYPNYQRGITVLFQTGIGFSNASRQDFQVNSVVALVDVGQVDGEKGLDIACLCENGVGYYPLRGRKYGSLIHFADADPFTAIGEPGSLPYYDFLQDWNGDGRDELFLPEFKRSLIFYTGSSGLENKGNEIQLSAYIDINIEGPERMFQEHHSLRSTYFMPQLNAEDFDHDGKVDLVGSYRGKLSIFKQLEDGRFSNKPTWEIRLNLPEPPQHAKLKKRGEKLPPSLLISDVNKDGRMDVIASQLTGEFGDMVNRTFVFYGHTNSLKTNRYDQLIECNNAGAYPLIRDIDGNGTMDLIIPYVKLDLMSLARMIATSSINVNFDFYKIEKNGRYPDKASGKNSTVIKINLKELSVEGGVPNVDGDFDNDGINDVVVGKNFQQIQVWKGDGTGNYDENHPLAVIPVQAPLFPDVVDLDNDGFADIVVSYIPYHDNDHDVFIFLNNRLGK